MTIDPVKTGGLDGLDGAVQPSDVLVHIINVLRQENAQLQEALDSRIAIEQAKGVLAERLGLTPDEAFTFLRRAARTRRIRLHDLACDVVRSRKTPPEI